jgi:hypothetical protein
MQHVQLNNEQDAIKQAVEAGYPTTKIFLAPLDGESWFRPLNEAWILEDPAFWQALGKARGWRTREYDMETVGRGKTHVVQEIWKTNALRYFETRLSGGDTSAFWQSLP